MQTAKYILKYVTIYLLLSLFTWLMLMGIVRYFALRDDVGFLQFKQPYLHITHWKVAFYTHVFSVIFTLLAGFTQFSNTILKEHRRLHRLIGKVYAYDILFINFPAAMVMAIYANGGLPGRAAFILLDCLWFWFTLQGVIAIRKGDIKTHRQHMIRSYALTLSAVSLRLWKSILSPILDVDPVTLYMIDAWLGFVPNLLFAEWLIRWKFAKKGVFCRGISTP